MGQLLYHSAALILHSNNSKMFDHVPEEILISILTRLPPKSLINFRCVSKSWNSLISSPYFIALQCQQAILSDSLTTTTNRLLIKRYSKDHNAEIYSVHSRSNGFHEDKNIRIENPFRHPWRLYNRIVGSSNGVLCISKDFVGHTDSVFLWNPAIRRKVVLPLRNETVGSTEPCMCVLGFGFDMKNNDYKVVRISATLENDVQLGRPKVEVYALSAQTWRGFSGKFPSCWLVDQFWSQAFVNGNVHWVGYRPKTREKSPETVIILFDLSNEVFDEMPLPDALKDKLPCILDIFVLEQLLAVYHYERRENGKRSCSIWVMKNYGDVQSWSKQFYVDLERQIERVIGMTRNGNLLLTVENQLVACNPETGTRMELGIHGHAPSFLAFSYVETLGLFVEGEEARESKNGGECGPSEGIHVNLRQRVLEMFRRKCAYYDIMKEKWRTEKML